MTPPEEFKASQQALEQNVFASAKNSELQLHELRRIADALNLVKWAAVIAVIAAGSLIMLVLR